LSLRGKEKPPYKEEEGEFRVFYSYMTKERSIFPSAVAVAVAVAVAEYAHLQTRRGNTIAGPNTVLYGWGYHSFQFLNRKLNFLKI